MKHLAILAILLASLIAIEAVKLDLTMPSFKNIKNGNRGVQKTPRDFKRDDGSSYSSMCWYQSSDGFYYDLSALQTYYGSWVNVDASGNTWYWNVCGDLSNMNVTNEYYYEKELKRSATTSCSPDSAICIKTAAGEWINAGKAYSSIWSDSVFGTANGVTVTIYEGDICGPERATMMTSVQHVCQEQMNTPKPMKKSEEDPTNTYGMMEVALVYEESPCYPQMYIYSPFACPYTTWEEETAVDGGDDDDHNDDDDEYEGGSGSAFFILTSLAVCCCCTLMCCCFRKRRCQMQKSSYCRSSEMQPIPTSEPRGPYPVHNQFAIPMQAPGPYFQPHQMQAPQMQVPQMQAPVQYYYYPPNGGAMPPFVPLQQMNMPMVPLDQVASDEELARQLQAQINQE